MLTRKFTGWLLAAAVGLLSLIPAGQTLAVSAHPPLFESPAVVDQETAASDSISTSTSISTSISTTATAATTTTAPSASGTFDETGSQENHTVSGGSSSSPSGAAGTRPGTTAPSRAPTSSMTSSATTTSTTKKPSIPSAAPGKIVVGYYGGWSAYSGYTPDKIPAAQLTQVHYAFATINTSTHRVVLADPAQDRRNFEAFRRLKQSYPHLRVLLSVGGWDYSAGFSAAAATAASREAFAQSCLDLVLQYGLDGVDIDWEYPVSGSGGRPADRQNFTLLLQAIRAKFDAQGAKDGNRYLLSAAISGSASYLKNIELKKVAAVTDTLFLMAYDLHGPWDSYADLLAPLYTPSAASPQYKTSVDEMVSRLLSAGAPANKLVLGMPFYGYLYTGVSGNGLYSRFSSAKSVSYSTIVSSYLNKPGLTAGLHAEARVPTLSGNGMFLTYENPASIGEKAAYARKRGLAGVGAWELSQDRSGALLASARRSFLG